MYLKLYFHLCCNSFEVYEMTLSHMYKSLVFGDDEFVAQGLHLKSHQRCSDGIRTNLNSHLKFAFFSGSYVYVQLFYFKSNENNIFIAIKVKLRNLHI